MIRFACFVMGLLMIAGGGANAQSLDEAQATFDAGDHVSFIPIAAICANSGCSNAVPWVMVVCGAYRQPSGFEIVNNVANSSRAFLLVPSPAWMR